MDRTEALSEIILYCTKSPSQRNSCTNFLSIFIFHNSPSDKKHLFDKIILFGNPESIPKAKSLLIFSYFFVSETGTET